MPERVDAGTLSPEYLRGQLALVDTERLLCQEAPRAAQLAYSGARLAERLGDVAGAQERYETATELDATFGPALRGIRRMRLAEGKADVAANLVDRELERASKGERPGLLSLRAELALALGDREQARKLFRKLLEELPGDLGAALGPLRRGRRRRAGRRSDRRTWPAWPRASAPLMGGRGRRLPSSVAVSTKRPGVPATRWRAIARRSPPTPPLEEPPGD